MERSFAEDVKQLGYGAGQVLRGEGILAITKALLQSGVSYVGGYPGAPISHLLDVLADANESILGPLGIYFEVSGSEAAAAAMLGASINYPMRGAVTWKSVVGTNVASDALSHVASAGVVGGALVVIGEDYGEGASILQERTHSAALKSSIPLLDPRNSLASFARLVEEGFGLSEACHEPVFFSIRIRACHMRGTLVCKDNLPPRINMRAPLGRPSFSLERINLPPFTYQMEAMKFEQRLPAARRYVLERGLNEHRPGAESAVGLVMQGGLWNTTVRGLHALGLADLQGRTPIPLLVLNVLHPLVPEELGAFLRGKHRVLVVEEGMPNYIERELKALAHDEKLDVEIHGKDLLSPHGEYVPQLVIGGLQRFLASAPLEGTSAATVGERYRRLVEHQAKIREALPQPVARRPPSFCTGCPERPVFSAMKILRAKDPAVGDTHVSADIGCHTFSTQAPFNVGNSVLGYGMGLASSSAVAPLFGKRVVSVMGDGGFWHNGLTNGVANAVYNRQDSVLVILDNFYTSATGQHHNPSTGTNARNEPTGMTIPDALRGVGVTWIRTVDTYRIPAMIGTLREALTTRARGLKVVIARGECQLERQRREKPAARQRAAAGERVEQPRFGVDPDVCTGDHSCMRLNGCPSLTLRANPDPLRADPIAHVDDTCVGCGVCGEVAHAAVLCPSFYEVRVVANPSGWERVLGRVRRAVIGRLARDIRDMGGPDMAPQPPQRSERPGEAVALLDTAAGAPRASDAALLSLLIPAVGGQGGGVLSEWIVEAATTAGHLAHGTSIPGVAQRTGSTTYYVEVFTGDGDEPPAFSLYPIPGGLDVLLAPELLEAGRMIELGFPSPARTTIVASTHRLYSIHEKVTTAGRVYPSEQLLAAARTFSRGLVAFDALGLAREHGTEANAVLLGALAGSGALPIPPDAYRAAIERKGIQVQANLRGFELGLARAAAPAPAAIEREETAPVPGASEPVNESRRRGPSRVSRDGSERRGDLGGPSRPPMISVGDEPLIASLPEALRPTARLAVARLVDYQDRAYAARYVERLRPFVGAGRDLEVATVVARLLAVWMTYEDAIRVADLKTRAARFERIRRDTRIPGAEIVVTDYLKPDLDELYGVLPDRLVAPFARWAERRWPHGRPALGQHVRTTTVTGYLRLWLLARCRWLRPISYRARHEHQRMERWLDAVRHCASFSGDLAREMALAAQLVKGYGEVRRRMQAAFDDLVASVLRTAELEGGGRLAAALARRYRALAREGPDGEAQAASLAGDVRARLESGDRAGALALIESG